MLQRLKNALLADILFQFKQGFYYVYIILIILYLILISQFDSHITQFMVPIVVYMDPSVLGLFFVGGITLLEKEQGILALTFVTPLRLWEYMASKVLSLTLIGLIAGLLVSLLAYHQPVNYGLLIIGIILTSIFYTLIGLIIACRSKSVNSFFVGMVPWMVLLILPCIGIIFDFSNPIYNFIPSVASLKIILAAYMPVSTMNLLSSLVIMLIVNSLLFPLTLRYFKSTMILQS